MSSPKVFINCPFDPEFEPLRDALFFTCICCGFEPRMSFDTGSAATPRLERIYEALRDCRFSIHDLSRCQGGGESNLARFNMPLELGMAVQRRFANEDGQAHDWLVLVPDGLNHAAYVSDLAGYDPSCHKETVETIVPPVMSWLVTRPDAVVTLEPPDVLKALPRFISRKAELSLDWGAYIPWPKLIDSAIRTVPYPSESN